MTHHAQYFFFFSSYSNILSVLLLHIFFWWELKMHLYCVRIKVFHSNFHSHVTFRLFYFLIFIYFYLFFRLFSYRSIFRATSSARNNAIFSKVHRFVMFLIHIHVLRSVNIKCEEVHKGENFICLLTLTWSLWCWCLPHIKCKKQIKSWWGSEWQSMVLHSQ